MCSGLHPMVTLREGVGGLIFTLVAYPLRNPVQRNIIPTLTREHIPCPMYCTPPPPAWFRPDGGIFAQHAYYREKLEIFATIGNILAYIDHLTHIANMIMMIMGTNRDIKNANESMIMDEGYLFMTLVTSFLVILEDREGHLTLCVFKA